jgi:hypothetical protein
MRIREVLRDLGITEILSYKCDEQTRAGLYGRDYQPLYKA